MLLFDWCLENANQLIADHSYQHFYDIRVDSCQILINTKIDDLIIADGPPRSISSRIGFKDGSSLMCAILSSSLSLWAGFDKLSSMLDMAGSWWHQEQNINSSNQVPPMITISKRPWQHEYNDLHQCVSKPLCHCHKLRICHNLLHCCIVLLGIKVGNLIFKTCTLKGVLKVLCHFSEWRIFCYLFS